MRDLSLEKRREAELTVLRSAFSCKPHPHEHTHPSYCQGIHRIRVQGGDFSSGESSVKIYRGPSPKIMTTLSQGIYEVVPNPIDLTPLYIYSYRRSCHHGCNFFTIQY